MTKVKICGMRSLKDIAIANEAMPDYVGFVFANSRRQVTSTLAKAMRHKLDPRIKAVGVFVQQPIEQIVEICEKNIIDVVQLHGQESLEYVEELKGRIKQPIIYAKPVFGDKVSSDCLKPDDTEYPVDYYLYDTCVKGVFGGTGVLLNYKAVPQTGGEFFLAGGLDAENVGDAIRLIHPYCVDASGKLETDGVKDREKILAFVNAVREADRR